MRALSVHQPYASLIAEGLKTIEGRGKRTSYRGPVLICATREPRQKRLPTGVAICVVDLVDCVEYKPKHVQGSWTYPGYANQGCAWILEMPRLITPFEFKGNGRLLTECSHLHGTINYLNTDPNHLSDLPVLPDQEDQYIGFCLQRATAIGSLGFYHRTDLEQQALLLGAANRGIVLRQYRSVQFLLNRIIEQQPYSFFSGEIHTLELNICMNAEQPKEEVTRESNIGGSAMGFANC